MTLKRILQATESHGFDVVIPKVLIVEDDPPIRALYLAALKREGLIVEGAADGAAALEMMRVSRYSVVVLDLMMPRMGGAEFLASYRTVTTSRPVIMVVTAFDDSGVRKLVVDNAHVILRKPFDVDRLVEIIRDCALAHVAAGGCVAEDLEDGIAVGHAVSN